MKKITIVGAGRVGESTAFNLARDELCREVMLIDIKDGIPQGGALDIQEAAPELEFDSWLSGSIDLKDMAGSDMVIITAGIPRKQGMSRSDVLDVNLNVIKGIVDVMKDVVPDALLIVVTNPVDVLTYAAWKQLGWPRNQVMGMAGVLDSARMATFISLETGYSVKDISAMVLGGHGDTMVPMPRFTGINGISIDQFISKDRMDAIIERTRNGGAEIIGLKQNSSAYEAPAAAIGTMVAAIAHDQKRIVPAVAVLDGEYGQSDICMGVPIVLGSNGMEKVIELDLNEEEAAAFAHSAEAVKKDIARLQF